jgi:hypothetical protein
MKDLKLKEVQRLMELVLAEPRIDESGQRHRMKRALREFEASSRSGKIDHDRLYRITKDISELLLEILRNGESRRPK